MEDEGICGDSSFHDPAHPESSENDGFHDVHVSVEGLGTSLAFINAIKNATLDESKLGQEIIEQIRNPVESELQISNAD